MNDVRVRCGKCDGDGAEMLVWCASLLGVTRKMCYCGFHKCERRASVCVCVTKELEIYYTVKLSYIYDRMGGGGEGFYSRVRCASKKDVDVSSFPFVEF